MYTI
jgi:hypothetical protein